MELTLQTVHAVCESMKAPHGKIETLCHGAKAVGVLNQDNMSPGMTPLSWKSPKQRPCIMPNNRGNPTENYRETKNKKRFAFRPYRFP